MIAVSHSRYNIKHKLFITGAISQMKHQAVNRSLKLCIASVDVCFNKSYKFLSNVFNTWWIRTWRQLHISQLWNPCHSSSDFLHEFECAQRGLNVRHPETVLDTGIVIIEAVVDEHSCLLHTELVHLHLQFEIFKL